ADEIKGPGHPDNVEDDQDGEELAQDVDPLLNGSGEGHFQGAAAILLADQVHGQDRHGKDQTDDRPPVEDVAGDDRFRQARRDDLVGHGTGRHIKLIGKLPERQPGESNEADKEHIGDGRVEEGGQFPAGDQDERVIEADAGTDGHVDQPQDHEDQALRHQEGHAGGNRPDQGDDEQDRTEGANTQASLPGQVVRRLALAADKGPGIAEAKDQQQHAIGHQEGGLVLEEAQQQPDDGEGSTGQAKDVDRVIEDL